MKQKYILHSSFYTNLFERLHLPIPYSKIFFNDIELLNPKKQVDEHTQIHAFSLFPNYLKAEMCSGLVCNKIEQKPGFAIDLTNIKSADDYLKTHCKSSFKKVLLRSIRRLESAFDISYDMFFGEINKTSYDHFMKILHEMIEKRFQQREGRNKVLENWDYYTSFCFDAINKKEASLFVISENSTPIEISLNFHYDSIMYSSISSYDQDYGKFSLGNIEIFKQLEWCISNGISVFDMGYGDFDYKRRWSNLIYSFETHLISENNSLFFKVYSALIKQKIYVVNFLIEKGVNDLFYNSIGIFKSQRKTTEPLSYVVLDADDISWDTNKIDVNKKSFNFLKTPVYDHLYKYQEHINDVCIYQLLNEENAYIIIGDKNETKLKFIKDDSN